jgi:hypothetical protein
MSSGANWMLALHQDRDVVIGVDTHKDSTAFNFGTSSAAIGNSIITGMSKPPKRDRSLPSCRDC